MKTTLLSAQDIRTIVRRIGPNVVMKALIVRLRDGIAAYDTTVSVVPPRAGFAYAAPSVGLMEWMPAMTTGETATIKVVGYHPHNPHKHELPTIISSISVYDLATGHLNALLDGVFVTALRTGAASALASQTLAHPESRTLGLIGAGAQAVTQAHAIAQVFPLTRVLVYDINPYISNTFADRIAFMALNVDVAESAEQVVANADIVCTATTAEIGSGPVFADVSQRPWLHINAVGSDFPGKIEVPKSLLERATVCPDFLDQAIKEGECQQLHADQIGPSLVQLLRHPDAYAHLKQTLTVFDSTGWALEDQIAAGMILDYARELGIGSQVEIEMLAHDPLNPYDFVQHGATSRQS